MSLTEFIGLINTSSDFRDYVFQAIYVFQRSARHLVPLADGDYALTVYIPEHLTPFVDNPPIVDLEPELIEADEDLEDRAL